MDVYLQPAVTVTHASCATASLAAELMVTIKEVLISLHRLRNAKPLPRALDDVEPKIIELCPKTQNKNNTLLPVI